MSWDPVSVAGKFLQKANAIHPEDAEGESYADRLAAQELYYECYMCSFSRDKLVEFLQSSVAGNIKVPDNVQEKKYRVAFVREAERLLKELGAEKH